MLDTHTQTPKFNLMTSDGQLVVGVSAAKLMQLDHQKMWLNQATNTLNRCYLCVYPATVASIVSLCWCVSN